MVKRFDYIWKDVKDDRGLSEIHDFLLTIFQMKSMTFQMKRISVIF